MENRIGIAVVLLAIAAFLFINQVDNEAMAKCEAIQSHGECVYQLNH